VTNVLDQCGFAEVPYDTDIPGYSPGLMAKALIDLKSTSAWEIADTRLVDPASWALRRAYVL
jgi:hypothetical protein